MPGKLKFQLFITLQKNCQGNSAYAHKLQATGKVSLILWAKLRHGNGMHTSVVDANHTEGQRVHNTPKQQCHCDARRH